MENQNPKKRGRPPGGVTSDETKAKMSLAAKMRWQNPAFRAKMRKSLKGRQMSDETKAKISQSHKTMWIKIKSLLQNYSPT